MQGVLSRSVTYPGVLSGSMTYPSRGAVVQYTSPQLEILTVLSQCWEGPDWDGGDDDAGAKAELLRSKINFKH